MYDVFFVHRSSAETSFQDMKRQQIEYLFLGLIIFGLFFSGIPQSFAQVYEGDFTFHEGSTVKYYFENGDANEMLLDEDAKSIIVKVNAFAEGTFAISIPRALLDAKVGSQDAQFFVLANGEQIEFNEERYADFRYIAIGTLATDTEYEIVGTDVYLDSSKSFSNVDTFSDNTTVYYYAYPLPDWADYADGVLDKAFREWEAANPGLKFVPVQSEAQANLLLGWVKDFGGLHVGYNLGNYIEIGLGDSSCEGAWQAYHPATIQYIAAHELGHYLGLEHSSNPNDLMYPEIPLIQYYDEPWEVVSAPGYVSFIPLCSSMDITAYQFQISVDNPNRFDVYFVPSKQEFEKSLSTTFDYYSDKGCWAENVQEFSSICSGVSGQGGLIVSIPDDGGRDLITISANLQETVLSGTTDTSSTNDYSPPSTFDSFSGTSSVFTDKTNYNFGDSISISGKLSDNNNRYTIQISVTDPLGQIVAKSRVTTTSVGEFQTFTSIPNYNPSGTYTISIYNDQGIFLGDAKFSIGSSTPQDTYYDYIPKNKEISEFKKLQTENFVIQYSANWDVDDEVLDLGEVPGIFSSGSSFVGFYDEIDAWDSLFEVKMYENEQGAMKHKDGDYLNYLIDVLRNDCIVYSFDVEGYVCSNHSITNSEIIKINGKQAFKVTETWTETYPNQDAYRNVRILVDIPVGNDVWSLDSTTTSSEYPKYAAVIEKMINSFKIIESGEIIQTDKVAPLVMIPSDIITEPDSEFGAFVEFSVKAIDDIDGILNPSCIPSSSSFFPIGKTEVKCSATDLSGNFAEKSFFVTVQENRSVKIPDWIKNVAEFWCNDEIEDGSFVESIQYLIDNNVIVVDAKSSNNVSSEGIPDWIKNNACWWSSGSISDEDFAMGLKFLIENGIVQV